MVQAHSSAPSTTVLVAPAVTCCGLGDSARRSSQPDSEAKVATTVLWLPTARLELEGVRLTRSTMAGELGS